MRQSKKTAVPGEKNAPLDTAAGLLRRAAPVRETRAAPRRIIGIDPGLASTGWGVIESAAGKIRYVDHGSIVTKADRPRAERLFFILEFIRSILKKYQPSFAAIETLYFGKNVSSAIPVAEARGVVCAALAERALPVHEITPNAIKKGVAGVANADKQQVQEMVRIILGLSETPKPDHAADALAAAICAANNGADDNFAHTGASIL